MHRLLQCFWSPRKHAVAAEQATLKAVAQYDDLLACKSEWSSDELARFKKLAADIARLLLASRGVAEVMLDVVEIGCPVLVTATGWDLQGRRPVFAIKGRLFPFINPGHRISASDVKFLRDFHSYYGDDMGVVTAKHLVTTKLVQEAMRLNPGMELRWHDQRLCPRELQAALGELRRGARFIDALWWGHAREVDELLQAPDAAAAHDLHSALRSAINMGHADIVKQLLARPGVDLSRHLCAHDKLNALQVAVFSSRLDMVELLLAAPGTRVEDVHRALWDAAAWGHVDHVKALLAFPGVDVNAVNDMGNTALFIARSMESYAVMDLLLDQPGIDAATVQPVISISPAL